MCKGKKRESIIYAGTNVRSFNGASLSNPVLRLLFVVIFRVRWGSAVGRGRVKRALYWPKMSSSQKGVVFFVFLPEFAVGAAKCAVRFQ
jgi:hypothetical protein